MLSVPEARHSADRLALKTEKDFSKNSWNWWKIAATKMLLTKNQLQIERDWKFFPVYDRDENNKILNDFRRCLTILSNCVRICSTTLESVPSHSRNTYWNLSTLFESLEFVPLLWNMSHYDGIVPLRWNLSYYVGICPQTLESVPIHTLEFVQLCSKLSNYVGRSRPNSIWNEEIAQTTRTFRLIGPR